MAEFAKIAVLDNEVQALLLDSALTEQDIPHLIVSYHDSAFDGLFTLTRGWGHVEAPADCKQAVLQILQGLEQDS